MLVEDFDPARHLAAVVAMCAAEGWPNWADPERAARAATAPGTIALVALDDEGEVTGFAHVLTDGAISAFLDLLVTAAEHRRRGVARALVAEAFVRCGVKRMDLLADDAATAFYESMPHRALPGYRIYTP
ncbi:GNAT family N-acetyltransferase [Phytomonospora sp. NPDC050363]|uniref:GNAT family N-acetyltransferase n=1 Tax=Phytomonospora sp. NPDC050363 TaxID=3155642 RepID=UPI0033F64899